MERKKLKRMSAEETVDLESEKNQVKKKIKLEKRDIRLHKSAPSKVESVKEDSEEEFEKEDDFFEVITLIKTIA